MQQTRPFLVVIAGPNGSGKSSLTQHLHAQGYTFGEYINPDDIAAGLSGSYEERVRRAQAEADTRRAQAIAARRSFSFETVFSHPSKLDVLDQARIARFEIGLFFVSVDDPLINLERVRTRVHLGGHDVPEDRIVARYHRTMAFLPEIVRRVDRAWIFDNSVRATDVSVFGGRVVAMATAGEDRRIEIMTRSPVPRWINQYLLEPARRRGWVITTTGDLRSP